MKIKVFEKSQNFVKRHFANRRIFVELMLISSVLSIAFLIRILPLKWGVALSEFDPWMQYKEAKFITDRGWRGFLEFFSWHDQESWHPWGRSIAPQVFPGLPFSLAFFYNLLSSTGLSLSLLELAAFLPAIYGIVAVALAYLLGKEIGGKPAGFLSAFLLAISSAYISRSHLGWFDDESLSTPLMLGSYLTYLVAIRQKSFGRITAASIISGLLLGYIAATWGASKFPVAFIPLFTLVLVILGRYTRQLLIAHSLTMNIAILAGSLVPKLGPTYWTHLEVFLSFATTAVLVLMELSRLVGNPERRVFFQVLGVVSPLVIVLGLSVVVSLWPDLSIPILGLGTKFLSVLFPGLRSALPIVLSVAENQTNTWALLFNDFGIAMILLPYGIYRSLKRGRNQEIFVVLFALFGIFFASSMVRLTLVAAPAIALLVAYTLADIFTLAGRHVLREAVPKKREQRSVVQEYGFFTPLFIVFIMILSMAPRPFADPTLSLCPREQTSCPLSPVDQAFIPITILASSVPVRQDLPAWANALAWMRDNLPPNAVVASWWDYGYWITIVGNKTSLIDNSTINSTQIATVAYAFMSNETVAYDVLRRYDVTHVAIFVTHQVGGTPQAPQGQLLFFGDEAKWVWMLRIANQEADALGITRFHEPDYWDINTNRPKDKFWSETLLGQLIPYKPRQIQQGFPISDLYEEPELRHFRLVYSSSDPYTSFAYVYLYSMTP